MSSIIAFNRFKSIPILLPILLIILILISSSWRYNSKEAIPTYSYIIQFSKVLPLDEFAKKWNDQHPDNLIVNATTLSKKINCHRIDFNLHNLDIQEVKEMLQQKIAVQWVQENRMVEFRGEPNDPELSKQGSLIPLQLSEAWDITTGGTTVNGDTIVIAILDSGYDVTHEDLIANAWRNRAEILGDEIDNDQNGYIDDDSGWNFIIYSPFHFSDNHGTSVAGILGAKGNNNLGISGVNWDIKLMYFDIAEIDDVILSYEYIIDQREKYNQSNGTSGAFVVATNASFGIDNTFCSEEPLWAAMYDEMGKVGILTGAGTSNQGVDVAQQGDIPATCPSPFLIKTLNTSADDSKVNDSSFSEEFIDLGTPGEGSFSTKINDRYGLFGGNSAAAPHLTGSIALLYASACSSVATAALSQPSQTALAIKSLILDGVDPVPSLATYTKTGGRLNVFKSIELLQMACGQELESQLELIKVYPNPSSQFVTVEYNFSTNTEHNLSVFNTLGQLIYQETLTSSVVNIQQTRVINTENWQNGMYILRIEGSGEDQTTSFLKL